jgi:phytoene dehydrogenase-like protein
VETFDVIVVGGGISGGLPAATYLQKAGLDVAIIEARPELGNFCPTHETWPETLDSPHASINFSGNSPAIVCSDLGLERWWPDPAIVEHAREVGLLPEVRIA